jgi:6-phosphofructokinase
MMNGLVLQCGGPTAVVNTSLAALVRRWTERNRGALWGGRYGLAALRTADWIALSDAGGRSVSELGASAGMALGGGRDGLTDAQLDSGITLAAKRQVDALFLIGGNGTMAAGRALAARAAYAGRALRIVAIPKTIDNDIPLTDVAPGFPSAARFVVDAVRDVAADVASMRGYEDVVLIEIMGRHAGWLTAAAMLARSAGCRAPHVVLVPELAVSEPDFLEVVQREHARDGVCVVAVAEGVRDAAGIFLAERGATRALERDASGQIILGRSGGPLPYLASIVRERIGLRCREVRPDVLQRCSRAHVTALDREIAAMVGAAAVDHVCDCAATEPVMIALRQRVDGWTTEAVPLDRVRGERTVPPSVLVNPDALRSLLL